MTTITLLFDREDIDTVSEMLTCGLQAIGEIEKTLNRLRLFEMYEQTELPDDLDPVHPLAGDDEWMSKYASALRTVDYIARVVAKAEIEGTAVEVKVG